ncbi:unnamed protein product [Rhizoctonia solani]|uniref:Uncharacterized protein n=1 Tax=Rhizoctonia solani TaxID=456999 RepID=A0A8H2X6Q7_9AGAM|nr:unnamed protein product [Rhizoctonia solani]
MTRDDILVLVNLLYEENAHSNGFDFQSRVTRLAIRPSSVNPGVCSSSIIVIKVITASSQRILLDTGGATLHPARDRGLLSIVCLEVVILALEIELHATSRLKHSSFDFSFD